MSGLGDILVVGLGSSGEAVARYCAGLLGTECDSVTVVDGSSSERIATRAQALGALGVSVLTGRDSVQGEFDLGVISPGIPPHSTLMRSANAVCARVISEIEFAYLRSHQPWVAITGTNGKTTTTSLVTHLLNSDGIAARSVGNIGPAAIGAVMDCDCDEVLVAEVSSFQLALTDRFHPRVAVLLNVTPDHIDWHGSFDAYVADKTRVFSNLTPDDVAVIDLDDEVAAPFAVSLKERGARVVGVSVDGDPAASAAVVDKTLMMRIAGRDVALVHVDELRIKGPHNVSNALAASATAHAMGASIEGLRAGLRTFQPIEHRLEPCGIASGVEWFNDSKATNPDAVFKALTAFGEQGLVLLLGGRNKGNDFRPLARLAAQRARAVVAFGEAGPEIAAAFVAEGSKAELVADMRAAIHTAHALARPGDAVVLSPACASFDEFENYEQRGRMFKQMVSEIAQESSS